MVLALVFSIYEYRIGDNLSWQHYGYIEKKNNIYKVLIWYNTDNMNISNIS